MQPTELDTTWQAIRARARDELTDYAFHIWIDPLAPAAAVADTLFLRAPRHIRTMVRDRYVPLLRDAARTAAAGIATVEVVDEDWSPPDTPTGAALPLEPEEGRLNPKYSFEQFVIGDGNRFAHAASLAAAEMPAQAYNPLFLHGPPGLGKTHLLHAIGNYVRRYGGLKVRYATVEAFTSEFVHTLRQGGDLHAFKERFREIDVLLIDDVQFLADKKRTKEEFFHTFNALYEAGAQLVLTSDRPPTELQGLEDRLRERFASGLVVEVERPDLEVRLAILRQRTRHDGLNEVAEDALGTIAEHVTGSVRSLEGALIRVVAYASLEGLPVSADVARSVLSRLYPRERCTLDDIRLATARSFGFEPADLLARDRRPDVAFARQVAMYLSRELTDQTLPAIGRSFGGRNHTTILHAHRRVARQIATDPDAADAVAAVQRDLDAADRVR
ncbi:MAG: chromosomal replication initiator protein DnaA [Thermoleophilaceae bacterium]